MKREKKPIISERELIQKIKNRDVEAFQTLHGLYKNSIFNYLYRVVGLRDVAEELTQDTFLSVYKSIDSYRSEGKLKSWIFTIATNHSRKHFRKTKRSRFVSVASQLSGTDDDATCEIFDRVVDDSHRPDQDMYQKELYKKIHDCISQLPVNYRNVITLCDLEGMSYAEAAEALNRQPHIIGTWLSRARRRFRKMINLDDFGILFFHLFEKLHDAQKKLLYDIYYQYKIDAYIDGELSSHINRKIKRYMHTYSPCQKSIEEIEKLKIVFAHVPRVRVSKQYDETFQMRFNHVLHLKQPISWSDSFVWTLGQRSQKMIHRISDTLWHPLPARAGLGMAVSIMLAYVMLSPLDPLTPYYAQEGQAITRLAKTSKWTDTKSHHHFQKDSVIQVAKESKIDFSIGDIYGLRVGQNSQIQIHDIIRRPEDAHVSLALTEGTLTVKLGKGFAGKTFEVQAGDSRIFATGTAFSVSRDGPNHCRVELIAGTLRIVHNGRDYKLHAHEYYNASLDKGVETGSMDLLRINTLTRELNLMPPYFTIDLYRISDLSAELALPATTRRARSALSHYAIKLKGSHASHMNQTISEILNTEDPTALDSQLKQFLSHMTKFYHDQEFTSQIFIFMATDLLHKNQTTLSLEILDQVVLMNHPTWASLSQCLQGLIYEEKLADPEQARKAYQHVLDQAAQSIEADEARAGLERLSSRPRP